MGKNKFINIKGLQYKKKTHWDKVFQLWEKHEGSQVSWQLVAREKGWESWKEWRGMWIKKINAQKREWFRYAILDPLKTVPRFRVGPSQSWQRNFLPTEQNQHTFATLIQRSPYEKNPKVQAILKSFPSPTEFIGICLPDQTIVMIEGHHRATALALAAQHNLSIPFDPLPTLALTFFKEEEKKLLDLLLHKGSLKENQPFPC